LLSGGAPGTFTAAAYRSVFGIDGGSSLQPLGPALKTPGGPPA